MLSQAPAENEAYTGIEISEITVLLAEEGMNAEPTNASLRYR